MDDLGDLDDLNHLTDLDDMDDLIDLDDLDDPGRDLPVVCHCCLVRGQDRPHLAKSLPELAGLLPPFAGLRAPTPAYRGFVEPSRRCLRLRLTPAPPCSASSAAGVSLFSGKLF